MEELTHVVRYIRNADPTEGTAAITLEGRPNLEIGGEPQALTDEEYNRIVGLGIVVEEVEDDANRSPAIERGTPSEDEGDGLDDATKPELEKIADAENVDLDSASNNAERVQLIREARGVVAEEGADSLPATATTGPTPPTGGGGGGAAGPEGAGGSAAPGGGAATAGGTGGGRP